MLNQHTKPKTGQVEMVPPVDGLDLLLDGGEFILVRVHDRFGERIRVGIRDAAVRVLLVVRPKVGRAKFYAVLAGVIVTVVLAFAVTTGVGLPPLLGVAMAVSVGLIGIVAVLFVQPLREYRFHDDMPGGIDRPPLMTLSERAGRQSWYDLRDEHGRAIGDISRRLGKWRVRGFEPIEPASTAKDAQEAGLADRIQTWSTRAAEGESAPPGSLPELSASIVRDYLNLASIVGGLVSGPIGIMLALSGPWKRIELRRAGGVVATGHRLNDGSAMRLEIEPAFDRGMEGDAWLDRRHLLALALLCLSFEAER